MASPSQNPQKKNLRNAFFIKAEGYFGNRYPKVTAICIAAQASVHTPPNRVNFHGMNKFDLTAAETQVYFPGIKSCNLFHSKRGSPMKDLTRKLLLATIPVLVLAGTFAAASTPVKANAPAHLVSAPMPTCTHCWPGR